MKRKKKRKLIGPNSKAEAWAKRNVWFGKDTTATFLAFKTHRDLIDLRVRPSTNLYYSLIDLIMAPHIIKWNRAHLSPGQKKIAKKLRIPLKAYRSYMVY